MGLPCIEVEQPSVLEVEVRVLGQEAEDLVRVRARVVLCHRVSGGGQFTSKRIHTGPADCGANN